MLVWEGKNIMLRMNLPKKKKSRAKAREVTKKIETSEKPIKNSEST